ncbi:MAG TPA: polysaccharide deacetylase family protein [Candidatus Omnitrophota bacterium]|nr:polysaccharide deacetylase family protein [Candidatus Omnitrophota bacterium]HPD85062.1 polysaccharide deacetylase family protein [Candidatus Omnitrophota bacterium]HRZ03920.1 polysaccharide deacetylase family protein [Candidatus Omnitrophota bacterium]
MIAILISSAILAVFIIACFCVFFDQAILTRKETIYRVKTNEKKVALTFDDGPSPVWTPKILDELKKADIKATFFMIGHHVAEYPDVAKRVAQEGHEIGNHGYTHGALIYYTTEELEEELRYTDFMIRQVTGQITKYYRPPKAWITKREKEKIKAMGYHIVLWSLNSKDWVTFDDKYIVKYILRNIQNGDILLFHDSGGVFKTEGGDRSETVSTIPLLAEKLKERGFKLVTVNELLSGGEND